MLIYKYAFCVLLVLIYLEILASSRVISKEKIKLRTLESRKLMPFFIVAYLLAKIKPREILFRQNPIKKLNESDYRKQTINSSQSRLSQTWKTKTRNANPNPNSGFSSL